MAYQAAAVRKFLPSPVMGVYRFRQQIDGCWVWYAIDACGRFAGLRVIDDSTSQAEAVLQLARLVYGDGVGKPPLTLHVPASSSPARPDSTRPARAPRVRLVAQRARSPRD